MEKIHQSSSGNQVYPVFPGVVRFWQRIMNNVLYLKWTVPCRLGENWAKNLLFSWAVLQVKSPIMARIHLWSLEGGCVLNRNYNYSLSSLVSRKIQVNHLYALPNSQGKRVPLFHRGQHRIPLPIPDASQLVTMKMGESFLLFVTKIRQNYICHPLMFL